MTDARSVKPAKAHAKKTLPPAETNQLVALFNTGRYADVESRAQALAEQYPDAGFVWKALGIALQLQGKDAIGALQKALELLPNDAEAHCNLGLAQAAHGQLDKAAASYRRALKIKPVFAEAHYNLGDALKDLGRAAEAAASYRSALKIKPALAEAHCNLGIVLLALGQPDNAAASCRRALGLRPDYAEAHSNLGNALRDLKQPDEAAASYRRALAIRPGLAQTHSNLGNVLNELGQPGAAAESCRLALAFRPDLAEAHNNLGNALTALGRLDDAIATFSQAIALKDDYAQAHSNLGNALAHQGLLEQAAASYRRALDIAPAYAQAHNNLGTVLTDLGMLDEAQQSYRNALAAEPGYTQALDNLGVLLIAQGQAAQAFDVAMQSLRIEETADARHVFADSIKQLPSDHAAANEKEFLEIRDTLTRALNEAWTRPGDLGKTAIDLLKRDPHIAACIARAAKAWPARLSAQELFGPHGAGVFASDPLLCALLVCAPVCDVEMERFLTLARHAMLEAAMQASEPEQLDEGVAFYAALARQCFINEYVFSVPDQERDAASDLRDRLETALTTKAPLPALWLIAIASYLPLSDLRAGAVLLESQWPAETETILTQQLREPMQERQLRSGITRLTPIEDAVSLQVQDQYEENPYPRWVAIEPPGKARRAAEYLAQKFPLSPVKLHFKESVDILVAGCGTGQHSIGTAQHFPDAHVLAVDLSLSSLAYAKRKTLELGIASIEYAQADILQLGSLQRSFDIIESSGVLHHMADPWQGWRVLLSLLRPGGLMRLGLYSETARRDIVKIRSFIAGQGIGSGADDIRRCRQELIDLQDSGGADFGSTLQSPDFFSISACRDLLFHVQEHRMRLGNIAAFLRENGLTFMGFEKGAEVLHAYRRRFPNDPAAVDLAQWALFEDEHPDLFLDMYQFWVGKTD